jgi:hypothetical protein
MPVQPKKNHPTLHPTVSGEMGQQAIPSFAAAWDYMAEEDKKALVELEEKYRLLARQTVDS